MQQHQLDHIQLICTSLQTDNHTDTSSLKFDRTDAVPDTQPTVSKHWRHTVVIWYNYEMTHSHSDFDASPQLCQPDYRYMLQCRCWFLIHWGKSNAVQIFTITSLYELLLNIYLHTHNGPLSGTTQVSRYQKGKTNLDFTEARDSKWQWHQLGHMQVCTSLQTDNHTSTPPLSFLQAGCPSCCPTNSVKALKAFNIYLDIDMCNNRPGDICQSWDVNVAGLNHQLDESTYNTANTHYNHSRRTRDTVYMSS